MNNHIPEYSYHHLLERAADEAGNLTAVARRTGISRRRLGKIKAGSPPSPNECRILTLLLEKKV